MATDAAAAAVETLSRHLEQRDKESRKETQRILEVRRAYEAELKSTTAAFEAKQALLSKQLSNVQRDLTRHVLLAENLHSLALAASSSMSASSDSAVSVGTQTVRHSWPEREGGSLTAQNRAPDVRQRDSRGKGAETSQGAPPSPASPNQRVALEHRPGLKQNRRAVPALTARGHVTANERERDQQSQLEALLSTRLSGTERGDVSVARPPPPVLPVAASTTEHGLQGQLTGLLEQSRVYRQGLVASLDSPERKESSIELLGLSPSEPAAELQTTLGAESIESAETSSQLRELAQASLAATEAMSQQLAKALHDLHELRVDVRVADDHRARTEGQLSSAEASRRALGSELERVAKALSIAAAERDAAKEKAAATQVDMITQQRDHKDQLAVLGEKHRRVLIQRDADIRDARRDARSDLLLFGVMQAAAAGADLSPARGSPAQGTPRSASTSATLRLSVNSSDVATRRAEPTASHQQLQQENKELRQRLLAAEASVAREKAKGDQWLSMLGSLREELAQAHRRMDARGGGGLAL